VVDAHRRVGQHRAHRDRRVIGAAIPPADRRRRTEPGTERSPVGRPAEHHHDDLQNITMTIYCAVIANDSAP
jgi:hypothetical protein